MIQSAFTAPDHTVLTIKALQVKAISHRVKHERWFFLMFLALLWSFATPERNPVKVRDESNYHPFAVKSPFGFTPLWLPYHLSKLVNFRA